MERVLVAMTGIAMLCMACQFYWRLVRSGVGLAIKGVKAIRKHDRDFEDEYY